jgi:hypothetical protein
VPSDPARQAAHLRDLNRASQPEKVVQLYESGAVAASEANLSEYLKALVRVDRLNESALLRTLQRGAAAEAGGSAGSAASRGSVSNRAAAIMTGAAESTSFSAGGACEQRLFFFFRRERSRPGHGVFSHLHAAARADVPGADVAHDPHAGRRFRGAERHRRARG